MSEHGNDRMIESDNDMVMKVMKKILKIAVASVFILFVSCSIKDERRKNFLKELEASEGKDSGVYKFFDLMVQESEAKNRCDYDYVKKLEEEMIPALEITSEELERINEILEEGVVL